MEEKEIDCTEIREKRYQWVINVLLIFLGFFGGVIFESERINAQVVTNTVEIRLVKESLRDIQQKLDMIINERIVKN